jgi:hypothetical protein
MPYFSSAKLLFLHIPKTGGTSVEDFLSKRHNTRLNTRSLFGGPFVNGHTRQHCTLREIRNLLSSQIMSAAKTFAVVRHPSHRLLSDLYYWRLLKTSSPTEQEVLAAIQRFCACDSAFDNHPRPQMHFLVEQLGDTAPAPCVTILHTESLTDDMRKTMGYTDFDLHSNTNKSTVDYDQLLTHPVRMAIQKHYLLDFVALGYEQDIVGMTIAEARAQVRARATPKLSPWTPTRTRMGTPSLIARPLGGCRLNSGFHLFNALNVHSSTWGRR